MGLLKPNVEKMASKKNVEGLIKALEYKRDKHVRERAVWALREIKDVRVMEALIQALKDEDSDVRGAAAEALVKIGKTAVEPLILALKYVDDNSRKEVEKALRKIGDEKALEPLIKAMNKAMKDEYIRSLKQPLITCYNYIKRGASTHEARRGERRLKQEADRLIKIGTQEALSAFENVQKELENDLLKQAREDQYIFNRRTAIYALGHIKSPKAVPFLKTMLMDWLHYESFSDTCQCLRKGAAYALGRIKDPATVSILVAALELDKINPNPDKHIASGMAIKKGLKESNKDFARFVIAKHAKGEIDYNILHNLLEELSEENRYMNIAPLNHLRAGGEEIAPRSCIYMAQKAHEMLSKIEPTASLERDKVDRMDEFRESIDEFRESTKIMEYTKDHHLNKIEEINAREALGFLLQELEAKSSVTIKYLHGNIAVTKDGIKWLNIVAQPSNILIVAYGIFSTNKLKPFTKDNIKEFEKIPINARLESYGINLKVEKLSQIEYLLKVIE